jgi:NO-binding membrane sensor protein with MHYT domain
MVRKGSFLIGAGLALMWWIGLSLNADAKILWFDAVAAVLAFGIGGLVDDSVERRQSYAAGPAVLGVGLAALWILGMAFRQPMWANWLNFVFAAASVGLAVASGSKRHVEAPVRSFRLRRGT